MKKILLLSLAIITCLGIHAQESPEGVMMKNGKMVVVRNSKLSMMSKDITFSNGSKIMNDGTVVQKDGSKRMMREGEFKDMSGLTVENKYLFPEEELEKDTLK